MKPLLTLVAILFTTVAIAQPPMQRPMPNQFRDFVDFKMNQEKPKVEHKDGKVIITMTEERFKMMQQRRRAPMNKFMMMNRMPNRAPYRQPMCPCQKRQEAPKRSDHFNRF